MMASAKSRKLRQRGTLPGLLIYAPEVISIPRRLGGGLVKEYAEIERTTGRVLRYSAVYINPAIYAGDNGRVLGYDNAHGFPHRHFMGKITREPELPWGEIREKFRREWREIARAYWEAPW